MINPDTEQVFKLSDFFHQFGDAVGEFIENNKAKLADDERNELFDKQIELLQISGKINMIGVTLVFKDVQESLNQLNQITSGVKETVKKALAVQDAINIAAAAISIGTAIISKNPQLIVKSTGELKTALESKKDMKI